MARPRLWWLCVLGVWGCQARSTARPLRPVANPSLHAEPMPGEPTAMPNAVDPPSQPVPPPPTPRQRLERFVAEHDAVRLEFTTFHWTRGDGVRAEAGAKPALRRRRPASSMPRGAELQAGDASVLPAALGPARLVLAIDHGDHQIGLYGRTGEGVTILLAAEPDGEVLSFIDFERYRFSPGTSADDTPSQDQRLLWAEVREGVLFVAQAHAAPVRKRRNLNGYLGAFRPDTGEILWRSEGLVVNAENFVFHDGYVLTGYGESAPGKSAIHAVRVADGSVERRVPVRSPARRFAIDGERLWVQTDNAVFSLEL